MNKPRRDLKGCQEREGDRTPGTGPPAGSHGIRPISVMRPRRPGNTRAGAEQTWAGRMGRTAPLGNLHRTARYAHRMRYSERPSPRLFPPSCLGPGSSVTLAPPRFGLTSEPPPNLRPTFTNRYILTSSRDQHHMLWITCG